MYKQSKNYYLIFLIFITIASNTKIKDIKAFESNNYISTYLDPQITKLINKQEVKLILEIGAHDCLDSILLSDYYNCPIIAFECLPIAIEKCKIAITNQPQIKLVEKAVWHKTGILDFHYSPPHAASSSCYLFDYESIAKHNHCDYSAMAAHYPMTCIQVEATRLDEWLQKNEIDQVDLICMDVQGAALPVLKSLGSYLKKIKYIVTEVEYKPIYIGEALFPEIRSFMEQNGFTPFNYSSPEGTQFNDVLFVRNDLLTAQ